MEQINLNRLYKICGRELTIPQKQALYNWGKGYEETIRSRLTLEYNQAYSKSLGQAEDNLLVAIAFVLHFGEKTRFGTKRLNDVMKDIVETVGLFEKRQYTPKEYLKMLEDDGIKIDIKLTN